MLRKQRGQLREVRSALYVDGAMNIDRSYQSASAAAVVSAPHQARARWAGTSRQTPNGQSLEDAGGGSSTAGTYLKATSGWKSYSGISNLDSYGFSVSAGGRYYLAVSSALAATRTGVPRRSIRQRLLSELDHSVAYMNTDYCDKYYAFSVRCVQD